MMTSYKIYIGGELAIATGTHAKFKAALKAILAKYSPEVVKTNVSNSH